MGSLVDDSGARFVGKFSQTTTPLPRLARQESLEAEPVSRHSRDGQGCRHGGGSGDRGDDDVVLNGGGDEPVSRVGHRGHPRICGDNDVVPVEKTLKKFGGSGGLVALEIGHHPRRGLDVETA